jgi:uncharacterized protein (TIGR03067 family)
MRQLVPVLLAALSLGFAPAPLLAPKAGALSADLRALQGEWQIVRRSYLGLVRDVQKDGYTATIKGDHCMFFKSGEVIDRWRISLRPQARPSAMDIQCPVTTYRGAGPLRCIYRLQGDTLTLAYLTTWPEETGRPTGFDSKGLSTLVLRRKKP